MKEVSNIGEAGIKSIRIGGMRVDDLPISAHAAVKQQLPLAIDNERQNQIEGVLAKYPKGTSVYFESRITEAKENVERQRVFKTNTAAEIAKYRGLAAGSDYRDREIKNLDPDGSIQKLSAQRGAERIRAENEDREPDYTGIEWESGEQEAIAIQVRSLKVTYPPYDSNNVQQQIDQFEEAIIRADEVIAMEYNSIAELTGQVALCNARDNELRSLGVSIGDT